MPTPSYFELPGSPTEDVDIEDNGTATATATRIFECDWTDRYTIRDLLLFGQGVRQYEYDNNLWARKATIAPLGVSGFIAEDALNKRSLYAKAQVTIVYKSSTAYEADASGEGNLTGAALVEQSVSVESQYLQLTSGKMYWDAAHTKAISEGQAPEKRIATKKYEITFHNISTVPEEFDTLIGSINTTSYEMVSEIIHGGTLHETWVARTGNYLYEGYTINRSITGFGTAGWDLKASFAEILNGVASNAWNYFFNPDTRLWSLLYDEAGNAIEFYPTEDWTNIGLPPEYVEP